MTVPLGRLLRPKSLAGKAGVAAALLVGVLVVVYVVALYYTARRLDAARRAGDRVGLPEDVPTLFGGVVEEVGRDVRGIRRGDRVAVDPIVSCHACVACLAGRINACRTLKLLGVKSVRVGGNTCDNPAVAVPSEKDIDNFFAFAKAAGVKVIYTLRLKGATDTAPAAKIVKFLY